MIDVDAYLKRLQWGGTFAPDAASLARLHERHRMLVPEENLRLLAGEPIDLAASALEDVVVRRRRGGCGLELNRAFALLLEGLGLPVRALGGRGARAEESDVLAYMPLLVESDPPLFVDVGSAGGTAHPMPFARGAEKRMLGVAWRLDETEGVWTLSRHDRARGGWSAAMRFDLEERPPEAFAEACARLEAAARAPDARPRVSAAIPDGRAVWDGVALTIRRRNATDVTPITGEAEIARMLELRFGLKA